VIKKDRFPHILYQARLVACTKKNAFAGWKSTGLYPFRPHKILKNLRFSCPTEIEYQLSDSDSDPSPKSNLNPSDKNHSHTPGPTQKIQDTLEYSAPLPITAEDIAAIHHDSVSNIQALYALIGPTQQAQSGSILRKQQEIERQWRNGCERLLADKVTIEYGEAKLREELKLKRNEGSVDTRYVAPTTKKEKGKKTSTYAEILDRGENLFKRKKQRDEEDERKASHKHVRLELEKTHLQSGKEPA
jgi:hypothetical protein